MSVSLCESKEIKTRKKFAIRLNSIVLENRNIDYDLHHVEPIVHSSTELFGFLIQLWLVQLPRIDRFKVSYGF